MAISIVVICGYDHGEVFENKKNWLQKKPQKVLTLCGRNPCTARPVPLALLIIFPSSRNVFLFEGQYLQSNYWA